MPNIEQNEPMEQKMDLTTARRVEQEKMTRRAALRKLGFGAGLAAFSLLGVDDLARMVGQHLERMAGDNKVVEQVAKEFQQAGVAFASPPNRPPLPSGCSGAQVANWCVGYATTSQCVQCCNGVYNTGGMCNNNATNTDRSFCNQDCFNPGGYPFS